MAAWASTGAIAGKKGKHGGRDDMAMAEEEATKSHVLKSWREDSSSNEKTKQPPVAQGVHA
eukprot:268368-Chlamydomonas_euryale.AAC.1